MTAARVTRWAHRVHRWLGVLGSGFIFVIAVTGAILVFRTEIDRLVTAGIPIDARGTPLPVDKLVATWRARHPGAVLTSLQFPIDGYGRRDWSVPYELWAMTEESGAERRWLLNPFTAETLAPPPFNLGQVLRDIHVRLLVTGGPPWLRNTALVFVGLIGVALAVSVVTGLIVHRRRLARELFHLRRNCGPRVFLSDLHKRLAVWALLFHLVSAATGAFLGLEAIWWLTRPADDPTAASAQPAGPPPVLLQDLVAAAKRAVPDAAPLQMTMPRHNGEPVTIVMRNASPLIHHWSSTVSLDPITAAVVDAYDASKSGFWARLYFMIEPLHFGYFGGLPVKILYGAFALGLAALPLTGVVLWWIRRKARMRRRTARRCSRFTLPRSSGS